MNHPANSEIKSSGNTPLPLIARGLSTFLAFVFFMLLFSPFWAQRHFRIRIKYTASESFRLRTGTGDGSDLFNPLKLQISEYEIPETAENSTIYTIRAFSPQKNLLGVYLSFHSKGNPVRIEDLTLEGGGKRYRAEFGKLPPEQRQVSQEVRFFENGGFLLPPNSKAAFQVLMPFHFRSCFDIDWRLFLYSVLLSLIPAVLLFRLLKNGGTGDFPDRLFVIAGFVLLLLPVSLIDYTAKVSSENRFYNIFPSLTVNSEFNYSYPAEFEKWLNDRFFGRKRMLQENESIFGMNWLSKLQISSAGMLPENDLALWGKEKWMFSKAYKGSDVALNKERFTENELRICAENLTKLEETFRKRYHAPMYLVLVPDKERVYPEFYPDHLMMQKRDAESRLEQLYGYLSRNTKLKIVYPLPELLKEKKNHRLYHKTGTHWTCRGAKIAADMLRTEIRKDFPGIASVSDNIREWRKNANADIDIALSFGYTDPLKQLDPDMITTEEPVFRNRMKYAVLQEKPFIGLLLNRNYLAADVPANGLRILSVSDSFWQALVPFLAPDVKESLNYFFGFGRDFEISQFMNDIDEYKPDAIVVETTERFLHRFLTIRYGD